MKTDGAISSRKQMKLTATERAILLDIAKYPSILNDCSNDEYDTDVGNAKNH